MKDEGTKTIKLIITDDEEWRLKKADGCFFCINKQSSYNKIKNIVDSLISIGDIDTVIFCDRCCKSPYLRWELLSKIKRVKLYFEEKISDLSFEIVEIKK